MELTLKSIKPQRGNLMECGDIIQCCLGTDREGITSWITVSANVFAVPSLPVNWQRFNIPTRRETALEKAKRKAVYSSRGKQIGAQLTASATLERLLEVYEDWQAVPLNSLQKRLVEKQGFVVDCWYAETETLYRVVTAA